MKAQIQTKIRKIANLGRKSAEQNALMIADEFFPVTAEELEKAMSSSKGKIRKIELQYEITAMLIELCKEKGCMKDLKKLEKFLFLPAVLDNAPQISSLWAGQKRG